MHQATRDPVSVITEPILVEEGEASADVSDQTTVRTLTYVGFGLVALSYALLMLADGRVVAEQFGGDLAIRSNIPWSGAVTVVALMAFAAASGRRRSRQGARFGFDRLFALGPVVGLVLATALTVFVFVDVESVRRDDRFLEGVDVSLGVGGWIHLVAAIVASSGVAVVTVAFLREDAPVGRRWKRPVIAALALGVASVARGISGPAAIVVGGRELRTRRAEGRTTRPATLAVVIGAVSVAGWLVFGVGSALTAQPEFGREVDTAVFDDLGRRFEYPSLLETQVSPDSDENEGIVTAGGWGRSVMVGWAPLTDADLAAEGSSLPDYLDAVFDVVFPGWTGLVIEPAQALEADTWREKPVATRLYEGMQSSGRTVDVLAAAGYDGAHVTLFVATRLSPAPLEALGADLDALMASFSG